MKLALEWKKLSWWFWLVTIPMLGAGLAGNPAGYRAAMGLSLFQLGWYMLADKSLTSFTVQVRAAYLMLLVICYFEPLRFIYWLPFCGTTAMVLVSYCPMARFLSLMPWNRTEPLTAALIRKTFLSPPVYGSILNHNNRTVK